MADSARSAPSSSSSSDGVADVFAFGDGLFSGGGSDDSAASGDPDRALNIAIAAYVPRLLEPRWFESDEAMAATGLDEALTSHGIVNAEAVQRDSKAAAASEKVLLRAEREMVAVLILRAEDAYARGEYAVAREAATDAHAILAGEAGRHAVQQVSRAIDIIGRSSVKLGDYDAALESLGATVSIRRGGHDVGGLIAMARARMELGDWRGAFSDITAVIMAIETAQTPWELLGDCCAGLGLAGWEYLCRRRAVYCCNWDLRDRHPASGSHPVVAAHLERLKAKLMETEERTGLGGSACDPAAVDGTTEAEINAALAPARGLDEAESAFAGKYMLDGGFVRRWLHWIERGDGGSDHDGDVEFEGGGEAQAGGTFDARVL